MNNATPIGIFSIDFRSLGLFRRLLALLVLADTVLRWPDIQAFYSDAGIFPSSFITSNFQGSWVWSLHLISRTEQFQTFLFAITAVLSIAASFGLFPQLSSFLLWALLTSRQVADTYTVNAGDELLRQLLFWSFLIPKKAGTLSMPTQAALLIQIACVYYFSAIWKVDPVWWQYGYALEIALRLDSFSTPIGRELLNFPALLRVLTYASWLLELLGPFLLFLTFRSWRLRTLLCVTFIIFHAAMALCFRLGLFPAICIVMWLACLPGEVWNKKSMPQPDSEPLTPREEFKIRLLSGTALYCLFLALFFNAYPFTADYFLRPLSIARLGELTQLTQKWDMFSPYPSIDDGWPIIVGTTSDSREVDLFAAGGRLDIAASLSSKPTLEKPIDASATYASGPWKKFIFPLHTQEGSKALGFYLEYLCIEWNKRRLMSPEMKIPELKQIQFGYVYEYTVSPHSEAKPKPALLYTQRCS